jgi:hypothetical protein
MSTISESRPRRKRSFLGEIIFNLGVKIKRRRTLLGSLVIYLFQELRDPIVGSRVFDYNNALTYRGAHFIDREDLENPIAQPDPLEP